MSYFKYRDTTNLRAFIDIIMNKRLYMSVYTEFNDPAEGFYMTDAHASDIISWIRNGKKKELICCLSKSNKHSLLWAHYANGHKGCCIEVEVTSPLDYSEVMYVNEMPYIDHKDGDVVKEVLSYKSKIWEYEQEIRYFKELVDGKKALPFLHVKVIRVYLGVKMDAKQKRFLTKLINSIDPSIEVCEMKIEDIDYGFVN